MNLIRLSLLFWINKPYSAILHSILIAVPVVIFISVGVIKRQVSSKLLTHSENVDLILSAPGNPLQITLSGILFTGNPSGTINVEDARKVVRNRAVRLAVPVILGDYYRGFRVIGTNHNYLEIQSAEVRNGRLWKTEMEVVIGHSAARKLNIDVGDRLSVEGENNSDFSQDEIQFYEVVGILDRSRTALDRVILTSVESFWEIDEKLDDSAYPIMDTIIREMDEPYNIFPFDFPENPAGILSCVLIQYRSPVAALTYPKYVKRESSLQPITPTVELLRLKGTIDHISDYFIVFAFVLAGIIGVLIVQFFNNILEKHETDFAVFRAIGSSRYKIIYLLLILALLIADTGAFTGIIFGHISAHIVSNSLPFMKIAGITGWSFYVVEILIYLLVHLLTILMASNSAIKAYNMDVRGILKVS